MSGLRPKKASVSPGWRYLSRATFSGARCGPLMTAARSDGTSVAATTRLATPNRAATTRPRPIILGKRMATTPLLVRQDARQTGRGLLYGPARHRVSDTHAHRQADCVHRRRS